MSFIRGSYVPANAKGTYWALYDDRHSEVLLAAEPALSRITATNHELDNYLLPGNSLKDVTPFSFFPPSLADGVSNYLQVEAIMTGGRTFLLSRESHALLGLPSNLWLDLEKLRWGKGYLEVRLEVKGAGTLIDRTKLDIKELENLLAGHPGLQRKYAEVLSSKQTAVLMSSWAEFMDRHMGGQSERFAEHAVATSSVLLTKSLVKFLPSWIAVEQSAQVQRNLDIVSEALLPDQERFCGKSVCEIRITPSTVRAIYFDNAHDHLELGALCSWVSEDREELVETLSDMINDTRRYLEILAVTTRPAANNGFTWVKVGDINEVFGSQEAAAFQLERHAAWVFLKDSVIVRRVGKFFTDMESYFGRDVGFLSPTISALVLHQSLYILAVLRDHIRICSQFAVGIESLFGKRILTPHEEKRIRKHILRRILTAINKSAHLQLTRETGQLILLVRYVDPSCEARIYPILLEHLPDWI